MPDVLRVLLAAGIPAQPDTEVPAELVGLHARRSKPGSELMGDEAILAFTRVLGAAAMNIAEAAVALFFAEFGPGTVREGPDELARARSRRRRRRAFIAVPDVLAQHGHGPVRTGPAPGPVRAAMVGAGVAGRHDEVPSGPTEIVALGFVDLVGSTAWAEALSLRDQSLALTRFESAAWSSAVLAGGRVVKMIGDEVFFAAPTVDAACRIGTEVCQAAADDDVLPPARGAVGFGR